MMSDPTPARIAELEARVVELTRFWHQACDAYARKNPSGCVCKLDPETDEVVSFCGAHKEWKDRAESAERERNSALAQRNDEGKARQREEARAAAAEARCADLLSSNLRLIDRLETVERERDELKARLQDPLQVHVALLRGEIAKPDIRTMLHAYGAEALAAWDGVDALRADAGRYRWRDRVELDRLPAMRKRRTRRRNRRCHRCCTQGADTVKAKFRVALPDGGTFYACWPQNIGPTSLRMVNAMLLATLDYWRDHAMQRSAGEIEYASWQPAESTNG